MCIIVDTKMVEAFEQGYMLLGKVLILPIRLLHIYIKNAMHSIPFHSHNSVAWSQCWTVTYKVSKGAHAESVKCSNSWRSFMLSMTNKFY